MFLGSVTDAHDALVAALQAASASLGDDEQFRVYADVGESPDPPAVYVSPPSLTWGAAQAEPSDATFAVAAVVPSSDRVTAELYRLLPTVFDALESVPDCVVRTAEPGTWSAGNTALPCYFLQAEVSL